MFSIFYIINIAEWRHIIAALRNTGEIWRFAQNFISEANSVRSSGLQ